jgi:hypothetical protein
MDVRRQLFVGFPHTVTLNYVITLNMKIMTVIQRNMKKCQGWSKSKAGKPLKIDMFLQPANPQNN